MCAVNRHPRLLFFGSRSCTMAEREPGREAGTRTETGQKREEVQRVYLLGFLYYNILLNFMITDYGGML